MLVGPADGSKGLGPRKGSGVLNPTAAAFMPRSQSVGSDIFMTPAPSLASANAISDLTDQVCCGQHPLQTVCICRA